MSRTLDAAVASGVASDETDTLGVAEQSESLASVCDLMSREARRRTVTYADRSAGLADVDWTCEKATALLLRRAGQSGDLDRSMRASVIGVNAVGDRATATVRFGGRNGRLSTIPLVKEDGQWKLGTPPGDG